ncbi:hypothetical protein N7481_008399 [Penicillium waksmanii]|uniref:uncharacterized protein n=1 Tax=Penicillium waksmanii TaxID=69791 RepID=UPI002546887F|nr:uncharacterized protein N7481_008399 [Penicillium waksmanii]KAJ5981101.1 hypothetical protein N7481_008399 [Penicillium waksmanii]
MHFAIPALITGIFMRTCLGGVFQVIDEDHGCKIYTNDVHGCTGYSASFATLHGKDCSDLTVVVGETRLGLPYVDAAACGQVDGKNEAWIRVEKTGEVIFSNLNGDKAKCKLDNGLNTGSSCSASDYKPLTSTSAGPSSSLAASYSSTAESGSSSTITSDSTSTTESESSLATTAGSASATTSDSSGSSCSD